MCTCDNNFNGLIKAANTTGGRTIVRSMGEPIVVTAIQEGVDTVYYIGYQPYSKPTCTLVVNPTELEVGEFTTATFIGTYTKGAKDITSKIVSPTVVEVTTTPFTFQAEVGSNTKGITASHTFTVSDGIESSVASAGITVKSRYYVGYSSTAIPSSIDDFGSGLGSSIQDVYGGLQTYVIPTNGLYIVWLTPDAWSPTMIMNGLPFSIVKSGTMVITNQYSLPITYNVWSSGYPMGATTYQIDMK